MLKIQRCCDCFKFKTGSCDGKIKRRINEIIYLHLSPSGFLSETFLQLHHPGTFQRDRQRHREIDRAQNSEVFWSRSRHRATLRMRVTHKQAQQQHVSALTRVAFAGNALRDTCDQKKKKKKPHKLGSRFEDNNNNEKRKEKKRDGVKTLKAR